MIRDTRRINIETDFFDDEQYYSPKYQEETFETSLLNRDKSAIYLYNTLDTLRLHRIINAFGALVTNTRHRIRKQSSRQIIVNNKYVPRKPQPNIYDNSYSPEYDEADEEFIVSRRGKQLPSSNKRQASLDIKSNKESSYLRQSRKRILQSINKTLQEKSPSIERQQQKKMASIQQKPFLKGESKDLHQQQLKPKQTLQIKNRLQRLQKLMKNIRQQKEKREPVIVHQKRQVPQMPKRQKNANQMQTFIEELHSLRNQIHEIRVINEQILQHSREHSVQSSRLRSNSEKKSTGDALNSLNYKVIKRSQVLEDWKSKQSNGQSNNPSHRDRDRKKNNLSRSLDSEKIAVAPHHQRKKHHYEILVHENQEQSMQKQYKESEKKTKPKQENSKPASNKRQQIMEQNIANQKRKLANQMNETTNISIKNGQKTKPEALNGPSLLRQKQSKVENSKEFVAYQNNSNRSAIYTTLPRDYIDPVDKNIRDFVSFNVQATEKQRQLTQPILNNVNHEISNYASEIRYGPQYQGKPLNYASFDENKNEQIKPNIREGYKLSPWYKQYGSPTYQPIGTGASSDLGNAYGIQRGQGLEDPIWQNSGANNAKNMGLNLKGLNLNEITDKVSYSNFNSARTSNFSYVSSPKSSNMHNFNIGSYEQKGQRAKQVESYYPKYNELYNIQSYSYKDYSNPSPAPTQYVHTQISSTSDYTNPNLLKELNIGPFPKKQSPEKPNYSYLDEYSQSSTSREPWNLRYASSNSGSITSAPNGGYNSHATYGTRESEKNKKQIQYYPFQEIGQKSYNQKPDESIKTAEKKNSSYKSIEDDNSYNSYTYSKNSSALTSMAKLQQQYQNVINSPQPNSNSNVNSINFDYALYNTSLYNSPSAGLDVELDRNRPNPVNLDGSNTNSRKRQAQLASNSGYSYQQIYEQFAKNK